MVPGLRPKTPGSIPDATKDPPSTCGVCGHKIHGSKKPMVDR